MELYTVTPRLHARQYDATNSAEILEPISPMLNPTIISEVDGVLVITPGPPPMGSLLVTTGQFVIYRYDYGQCVPWQAVDTLDGFTVIPEA